MGAEVGVERMWIGGEPVEAAGGGVFAVENPADESVIAQVPRGMAADADRAVARARDAQRAWRDLPAISRAELLHEIARRLRSQASVLGELLTREGGRPRIETEEEVEWVASCFDYYAQLGRDQLGRVIAPVDRHQFNFVVKEPIGVVACIVPWNYPLLLMGWKVAPALAAGNTVVVKPSEHTPLATLQLARTCWDHLPPGVVNVVTGYGEELGEALVSHPGIDMIAFTGSQTTGRKIALQAAQDLKRTQLELGGNDPFIVCDDVDLEISVPGAVWAAFMNMGQVCTSAERIYIFESVAREFTEKFVAATRALRLGDPLRSGVDLGPLAGRFQLDRVEGIVERARDAGARVLAGGKRPEGFEKGYWYLPTVLTDLDGTHEVLREETFGPVAPLVVVKGIEEACRLADEGPYGLGANILTNNMEYAFTAMETIKAGTFWINDPLTDNDAGPFGGMRKSGIGRELGPEGLDGFRDIRHVHLDYRLERKDYWFPYP